MKRSSISYYQFDDKSSCIIASLPQRNDTQVIYIDQIMGTLLFSGIKGYDVFDNRDSAFHFVSKDRKPVQCIDARSILGYVFSHKSCYLILIEKERPLFPIFDNHMIFAIEGVTFIEIPIETQCPQSNYANIESLKKYPFNHAHYFCPTLDLSKDFGSQTNTIRTCWNQNLMQPFKHFSQLIPNLCVSVFQGVASYTPFVEINIGILFMSSRFFPPILSKSGKHHFTEDGITCSEYVIDIYLIKNIENDFEVINHTIQIGDFPFNWSADQNSAKFVIDNAEEIKKSTKTFIQRQKDSFKYKYITFSNFMNKAGIERCLTDSLDTAINELSESINASNSLYIEQDQFEWIQSMKNPASLEEYVQNFWPRASQKIKKFGFTRSLITNISNQISINDLLNEHTPYQCIVQSRQKGIYRFLFNQSFDRELVGLFFYFMKLLEIVCLDELGLNFPEKLVMPYQINTFLNGFVLFSAKFLLEFYLYISNFANMPMGDLANLIFEYMKPRTVDIETYIINYQHFLEGTGALKTISAPSLYAVSQGPSSFVMNQNIDNLILHPFNNNLIEISKKDMPLIICLSEPCFIKYIILKSTNAIQLSVLGGYRLNRVIEIASNVILPWIPKTNQKNSGSYIRIDLESQSEVYDYNIKPHEFEKIRFLILKFKTFRKDQLKIGNIYAYGSQEGPSSSNKRLNFSTIPIRTNSIKELSSDPTLCQPSKVIPNEFLEENLELRNSQTDTELLKAPKNILLPQNPQNLQNDRKPQNQQNSQDFKKSCVQQTFQRSQSIDGHVNSIFTNHSNDDKNSILSQNAIQRSQSSLNDNDKKEISTSKQKHSRNSKISKASKSKIHTSLSKNVYQAASNSAKSRIDAIIENERKRIQNREDYLEFQKTLIEKQINLDYYDFEKILSPDKIEKEPKRTSCAKCQTKDMCSECSNCKRSFCKKCLKSIIIQSNEITFCEECMNKRRLWLLELEKLKMLQLEAIKEKYPFISLHNDQISLSLSQPLMYLNFILPSSISSVSDFSGFGDINRPLISTFAYEPPISNQIMKRLPECLFTSNVNWVFDTNFAPLTIIFTTECKITAIHITCFTKLDVSIEGATPSHLTFEPPGSFQKVEFVGHLANVTLSGSKIELRNIRFFGVPLFQKVENTNETCLSLLPAKPRSLINVSPLTSFFSRELNMHSYQFNSAYEFVGIKYLSILQLPSEVIILLENGNDAEYVSCPVARILPEIDAKSDKQAELPPQMGIVLFTKHFLAKSVKIFYPRLTQKLAVSYANQVPDLLILQKGKQNNK